MLRKIGVAFIVVPLAVIMIVFAVANRQWVTVSFDPFSSLPDPAYAASFPLFAIILVSLVLGVLIGGSATWLRQGVWRRTARRLKGEVHALRQELEAGHRITRQ
jgi:uncharacterized integral membrane protein